MQQPEKKLISQRFSVPSSRTGGHAEFIVLRDGTIWMSENGSPNPDDFVQVDPHRDLPGVASSTLGTMYYTVRLNQNMPASAATGRYNSSHLQNHMRQLVGAFKALQEEPKSNRYHNLMKNAFGRLAERAFDTYTKTGKTFTVDPRQQAEVFTTTFFQYYGNHDADSAFTLAWDAATI